MSASNSRSYTAVALAIVVAGVLISASLFVALGDAPKTPTATETSVSTSTATVTSTHTTTITTTSMTTVDTSGPKGVVFLMNVNGSYYWADDVSSDIVIGWPGYSYFPNGSVTFDGVKFQTICPASYRGCPGSNSSSTIIWANAISFNVTFPDKTTEQVGYAGLGIYTYVLSQHSPKVGMLIEYVNDYNYPNSTTPFAVLLLVSSCGVSPHLC